MIKNQKGTSLVAIIAVVAVLTIAGLVGYFVWDKNKTKETNGAVQTKELATSTVTPTPDVAVAPTASPAVVKVPEGYVLYENTNPKFSFVYPKEWDSHKDTGWAKGVKIDVKNVDTDIPRYWGAGPNSTFKYDTASKSWIFKNPDDPSYAGYTPPVLWKNEAKIVYDLTQGEGGGFQNEVAFIYNGKIYFIVAPGMQGCENTNGCYDDGKSVTAKSSDYLEQIAKSITF